jgi:hypothetical protein
MSKAKSRVAAVRVQGPLAPYAVGFESHLTECGYAAKTRATHLRGDVPRERVAAGAPVRR